ncbi:zinc finger protein 62 homolog isoform X2 [Homarus americanus]|uniref:zinc finger protein 62 homolog isoform X2 n=1 Tax=Homarus americanus TaxID=6706 RepID=UPI001C4871E2|nr:zinc finger protein 62 homolog isoform X2 [Homarus americanus]XP_042235439.1 zinc finger protein 62 homolog isoform X2 [Homarus americanus]
MTEFGTTPFEDLILGSQFLPALATIDNENGEPAARVGVLQCRRCSASFLLVREALSHYRLHVFETHKEHFTVVVGGACPLPGCALGGDKVPTIHFHCAYCCFTSTEIMDLPLHMEGRHLAFYREVSLVLRGDDIQRTKVYTCGECGKKIQGTVSTVQHFLAHDSDHMKAGAARCSTMLNGGEYKDGEQVLVNGDGKSESEGAGKSSMQSNLWLLGSRLQNGSEEEKKCGEDESSQDKLSGSGIEVKSLKGVPVLISHMSIPGLQTLDLGALLQNGNKENEVIENGNIVDNINNNNYSNSPQEPLQVELNPLDLLTTVIEEDQKSEYPILPAEHFLLSLPAPTHFLEGESGGQEDSTDGFQDGQDNDDDGSNDGYSDIPSDILLDHLGVYQCDKCEETFKYQYLLVTHKHQVHQGLNVPFECQVCGMEYTVLQELKRHMMTHSGANIYTCNVCSQGFSDRASLKTHSLSHGGTTERASKCESCACEFPSKSELTRHIVKYQGTCNPNKSEGVRCATCGEDLPTLEALKDHRRTAHPTPEVTQGSGKKGFECDYCGKTFNCRSNLRDHLVVHTGEKPYPCDICGKSFSFIHNMKTHRLTHNEGRNEVCPYCDKAYKSKISLYYHMKKGNCRGLSTKEVPEGYHRCTECLQMFASEERFKIHKDKGHCQVSHRCQHCGLRCSTETRLQNHLQKGVCQKKDSPSSQNSSDAPKKRRLGKEREKPQEEIVCDRCNYTKDCCCTFSCNHCGKRVFSIMAYTLHSERTCPVLKHRRERIRMAIMEKRRRREGLAPSTEELTLPLEIKPEVGQRIQPYRDFLRIGHDKSIDGKDFKRKSFDSVREDMKRREVVIEKPVEIVNQRPEDGDGDDSSSGSLTDLSTFTSPNILQPVTNPTDE